MPPTAIRTRPCPLVWSFTGANEHLDEAVLSSDALDRTELRDESDVWLSDFVTLSGLLGATSGLRLAFLVTVFGSSHSSGKRMSAMDPSRARPLGPSYTFPLW